MCFCTFLYIYNLTTTFSYKKITYSVSEFLLFYKCLMYLHFYLFEWDSEKILWFDALLKTWPLDSPSNSLTVIFSWLNFYAYPCISLHPICMHTKDLFSSYLVWVCYNRSLLFIYLVNYLSNIRKTDLEKFTVWNWRRKKMSFVFESMNPF